MKTLFIFIAFLLDQNILAQAFHGGGNYIMEFNGHIDFDTSTGKAGSSPDATPTALNDTSIKASTGFGVLAGENLEPIIEVQYKQHQRKVAEFSEKKLYTEYGLGLIFNLPLGESNKKSKKADPAKPDESKDSVQGNDFSRATWIPFLGFLLTVNNSKEEWGENDLGTYEGNEFVSKLCLGVRYMLFQNVGLSSSIRASYQNSTGTAETENRLGGTTSKLLIESRIISLSLFI